jgi:hypothetical protein
MRRMNMASILPRRVYPEQGVLALTASTVVAHRPAVTESFVEMPSPSARRRGRVAVGSLFPLPETDDRPIKPPPVLSRRRRYDSAERRWLQGPFRAHRADTATADTGF